MKIISLHRPQQGLSLIELMIAITLSLVLTLGVIQIFSSSKQTNRVQTALGGVQENARFALDLLSYDLRLAGNIGCNRSAAVKHTDAADNLPNIGNGINGYEYSQLPALLLTASTDNPSSTKIVNGTDTLIVRYMSPNTTAVASGTINSVTLASKIDIKKGDPLIISDCQSADIFVAASDSTGTAISLTAGQNFSKTYGADAEVAPLKYVAYYIKEDEQGYNNLYRSVATGISNNLGINPDPLLQGVDNLQLLYGEDLNGNGNNIRYVAADAATPPNMDRVTSVRLSLLLSSVDKNITSVDQNYWLNGELKTVANDGNIGKKLLRSFTTTVKVRNKGIGL